MASLRSLRGSCSCGRNRYIVQIPIDSANAAQVYFDNTSSSRRQHASPITAFIHVPISWYQSSTFAYFPDETHASIRKTYESPDTNSISNKRQFCGFCGTQLSSWDERTRQRAEGISLTLGSLEDEDLVVLDELGLMPDNDPEEETDEPEASSESGNVQKVSEKIRLTKDEDNGRGAPWFEELIEDSKLGRVRRQRGGHTSHDGMSKVEWEIVEIGEGSQSTAKRKIEHVEQGSDPYGEDMGMSGI